MPRKKAAESASSPEERPQQRPQPISLQVPENVNLVEMSNDEIERLALDLARKTAATLPSNSALLGIDRLTLTTSPRLSVEVWGEWSRSCFRTELSREGLVVDPEVFRSPIDVDAVEAPSVKSVIQGKIASTSTKSSG